MEIKFFGATEGVTGSNQMLIAGDVKILLDCGLFQGSEEEEKKNSESFPYDPNEIDFLILGHAHIDHSGRIPKLVKDGFRGRIISHQATMELSDIMLRDSAHIQANDAEWENRKRERSGLPLVEPLYTEDDVSDSMKLFEGYYYDQLISLTENIKIRFRDAGHILGSCITEIFVKEDDKEIKIVYAVDIGMPNHSIISSPEFIEDCDYLIIESTYGDRTHESYDESHHKLMRIVRDTVLQGGTVIIPSFAVGRTQEIVYAFNSYYDRGEGEFELPDVPIYVDSPMAVDVTEVFMKNAGSFDEITKKMINEGDNPFLFKNIHYVRDVDGSRRLNENNDPKVVISSSGMATAGRVRHHLKHNLWKKKTSVVFVGYQAQGSLGRLLIDGIKRVRLFGEDIQVNSNIYSLEGMSAHADREFLLEWISHIKRKPKKVFLVHGESDAKHTLKTLIERLFLLPVTVAKKGMTVELTAGLETAEIAENSAEIKTEVADKIRQLKEGLSIFESGLNADGMNVEDFVKLNNRLIEMQQAVIDLQMQHNTN